MKEQKGDLIMSATLTNYIYWLDEIDKDYGHLVGKKCANLGELTRAGFPVPRGFALSVDMYKKFMNDTGAFEEISRYLKNFDTGNDPLANLNKYNEASNVLRHIVETKWWPSEMEDFIARFYERLCEKSGIDNVPVAVRSAGLLSYPGQYETYLYVRGKTEVMKHIIKVFSSTFNVRSLLAREKAGRIQNYEPIGIAVNQMVNAKAAGVIFTLNPVNGDKSKIAIEGNWGLGQSVVGGFVTPDEWKVDKVVLEIISRKISSKQIEYLVDHKLTKVTEVHIPKERQAVPCLTDEEIIELARIAKAIEKHFGTPQDIEWAIEKESAFPKNIFFVQTRPETVWNNRIIESKLKTTGSPSRDVISFYRNLKA